MKFKSEKIIFNSEEEKFIKLKEWKIISKKQQPIFYKNNCNEECDVIGYITKKTNAGCINDVYETIIINVMGKEINISIDYLKEMQKKNYKKIY